MEPLSIRRGKSQENYSDYRWICERIKELEMLPDVFFCANDEIAVTLIRALREMGLMVPEDIKVVGFDDMPVAALSNPTLTTVRINSDTIGMIAADLLLSRIQNQKLPSRYTYVQTTPVFYMNKEEMNEARYILYTAGTICGNATCYHVRRFYALLLAERILSVFFKR